MSSNFSFNSVNNITKEYSNEVKLYKNAIKNIRNKKINQKEKNNIKKNLNNTNDKLNYFKNQKNIMILEKSYNDSLSLLEMIKKQTENNVLKKYHLEKKDKNITNINNEIIDNEIIDSILMKKKFLMTLLHF